MKTISIKPKSYGQHVHKNIIAVQLKVRETIISQYERNYQYLLVHNFIGAN